MQEEHFWSQVSRNEWQERGGKSKKKMKEKKQGQKIKLHS